MVLDEVHCLTVEFLDALPDLTVYGFMVGELEPVPPVAEVAREDEDGFGVIEVFGEDLPVVIGHFLVHWTRHDGNQLNVFA